LPDNNPPILTKNRRAAVVVVMLNGAGRTQEHLEQLLGREVDARAVGLKAICDGAVERGETVVLAKLLHDFIRITLVVLSCLSDQRVWDGACLPNQGVDDVLAAVGGDELHI
jgi:hypothetical protein